MPFTWPSILVLKAIGIQATPNPVVSWQRGNLIQSGPYPASVKGGFYSVKRGSTFN